MVLVAPRLEGKSSSSMSTMQSRFLLCRRITQPGIIHLAHVYSSDQFVKMLGISFIQNNMKCLASLFSISLRDNLKFSIISYMLADSVSNNMFPLQTWTSAIFFWTDRQAGVLGLYFFLEVFLFFYIDKHSDKSGAGAVHQIKRKKINIIPVMQTNSKSV